jgi:hypothetical protein
VKAGWGLLLALATLAPSTGHARSLPRYGTFAYSNLCWQRDTTDVVGARLMLSRTRKGARLDFEYGDGPLQSARIKSLKINADRIEAEASTADGELGLAALFGPRTAKISMLFDYQKQGPPDIGVLKRIKSFRQKIPACRD